MRVSVTDVGSNYEENLQRWARTLGKGDVRRRIFLAIYKNKKALWPISEVMRETHLERKVILTNGKKMCVGGLFDQLDGTKVIYKKIDEVHHAKQVILRLAGNAQEREALPTKRRVRSSSRTTHMKIINKFENNGVVNTGSISGSVTGNSQKNQSNESAKALLSAVAEFKRRLESSPSVSSEQREDAIHAVHELETEATKDQSSRNMSRIRTAVNSIQMLGTGTQAIRTLYEQLHPIIASHFHLI